MKKPLHHHYEVFKANGADIKAIQKPQGMRYIEAKSEHFVVKTHNIELLEGVCLDFGSYQGDFSQMYYVKKSPSVHFGLLQSGAYHGVVDETKLSLKGGNLYSLAPDRFSASPNASSVDCTCVQISLDISQCKGEISRIFRHFDVEGLYECLRTNTLVMNADAPTRALFDSLSVIHNTDLLRLKVLECLIYINKCVLKMPYMLESHKSMYIEGVKQYLHEHFNNDELSLRAIAEKFEVSVSKLSADFKCYVGTSLYQYLKTYRMQRGLMLLHNTNKSITQIAHELGYNNVSAFCKNFKSAYGKSALALKSHSWG
ncbi:helix-turn-helix domain-containing protein [Helicobacter marmotae]|uniref:AraC family transcriptional regulator n=1 Tax=Helicobacter marmotae TaxID=152490 RepID=A0A3D8I8R4_9HELI|nr:AraC family transcriptional regulator [Helicobacter marmotae]RDU60941.1 AraC family transcriptional regulator [Helicobacter marmotae]